MKISSLLCLLASLSILDCTLAASAQLTIPQASVTVNEKEPKHTRLTTDKITCTDGDTDQTRAYISAVNPNVPCTGCFALELCDGDRETEYCLTYQPSQGTFVASQVDKYRVTIVCTDDTADPATTGVVEVVVKPNGQPSFDVPGFETGNIGNTQNKNRGAQIFPVLASDPEGDALYFTMTSEPDRSDLFYIELGSGVIRAKEDLKHLCTSPVTFKVFVRDEHHGQVGPKTVQIDFEKRNEAPKITNTASVVRVDEDVGAGNVVIDVTVNDNDVFLPPNSLGNKNPDLEMTADPKEGLDIYKVEGSKIKARRELDYEYAPLREVDLTIRAFDGFCFSTEYKVKVIIENVNEQFDLYPDFLEPTMNEGWLTYKPNITIVDQDARETFTFTRITGAASSAKLDVTTSTGVVKSNEEIKAEPKEKSRVPVKIQVEDSGGNTQDFTVNITVLDVNDNKPIFAEASYIFDQDEIRDCTELGTVIGTVAATDDDSPRNGNNLLVYSGGGSSFTVLSDGTILYTKKMKAGDVDTGSALVTDQGLDPGPLQGLSAVVTVKCGACPPTTSAAPTTTAAPTTPPPTTTTAAPTTTTEFTVPKNADAGELLKATDTSSNGRAGFSDSVAWMTTAAVAFAALVVVLTVVLCRHCGSCCAGAGGAQRPVLTNHGPAQGHTNGGGPTQVGPQQYGNGAANTNPALTHNNQQQATTAVHQSNKTAHDPLSPKNQQSNGPTKSPRKNGNLSNRSNPNGPSQSPQKNGNLSNRSNPQNPNGPTQSPVRNEPPPNPSHPQQQNGPSQSPRKPDGPGPNWPNPQQAEASNQPQQQPHQQQQSQPPPSKPKMDVPGMSTPAGQSPGRAAIEETQPSNQPDNQTKNKTSPRKEEARPAETKPVQEASHAKPDDAKKPDQAKGNVAEYPLKPKMQIGDSFELEIITPRNSPLPYVQ